MTEKNEDEGRMHALASNEVEGKKLRVRVGQNSTLPSNPSFFPFLKPWLCPKVFEQRKQEITQVATVATKQKSEVSNE